jgi:SAM-dependent methyltransferase
MDRLPDIRRSNPSSDDNDRLIARYIGQKARPDAPLSILEAGCGQEWWLDLDGTRYSLCGVDIDRKALEIRKYEKGDLDEIIEGDLRTVDLGQRRFDVIYCSFVLEHVEDADVVLKNFVRWLEPGGLLIVRIPDPDSVRGFITRLTPHWFHVLVYKHLLRRKNAGQPGYGPYATFFHPWVSRRGIYDYCRAFGFTVKEEHGEHHPDGEGRTGTIIQFVMRMVAAVSFGKLTARHANLLYILEKAPGAAGVDQQVPTAESGKAGAANQTPPTHAALLHR